MKSKLQISPVTYETWIIAHMYNITMQIIFTYERIFVKLSGYNFNTVAPENLNLEYPAKFDICFFYGELPYLDKSFV